MFGWSYFRFDPDRYWRLLGFQLGYHRDGRRRYFSERNGHRKGPVTVKVGHRAEISFCRVDRR